MCYSLGTVPNGDTHRLFATTVPGHGNDGEEGQTGSLEQSQEETVGNQSIEASDVSASFTPEQKYALCGSSKTTHESAPAEHGAGHENTVLDTDNQISDKRLSTELSPVTGGTNKRVLATDEVLNLSNVDLNVAEDLLLPCEDRRQHRNQQQTAQSAKQDGHKGTHLVENLQEVDPHEDRQNPPVNLPANQLRLHIVSMIPPQLATFAPAHRSFGHVRHPAHRARHRGA